MKYGPEFDPLAAASGIEVIRTPFRCGLHHEYRWPPATGGWPE
jgi:hypothetical protein